MAADHKETARLLKSWVAGGQRDWNNAVEKFYLNDLSAAFDQIGDFEAALSNMRDGIWQLHIPYVVGTPYEAYYDELNDYGFDDLDDAITEAEHDLSQMIDDGWADDDEYEDQVQEEIEGVILPGLESAMDAFMREHGTPTRTYGDVRDYVKDD